MMDTEWERRQFLQMTLAGGAVVGMSRRVSGAKSGSAPTVTRLVSPGCRRSKVKIARIFMGQKGAHWPHPKLDLEAERRSYDAALEDVADQIADVDFVVDELVASPEQVAALRERISQADGVLAVHLTIGISAILDEILSAGRPTMVFAVPYSGHEWSSWGAMLRRPEPPCCDVILSADKKDLAVAVRPLRALHHLREAKIVNVTLRQPDSFHDAVRRRFGTEIKHVGLEPVVAAYEKVSDEDAQAEADRWMDTAERIVEPTREEILRSCKLALAFERLLAEEDATVLTVDCYGTMWDKTIKLPAYPCLGFSRLNNLGLGGICESDLRCAMTHIIFQGLAGKPGFISDPTVDESTNTIILAHCMGTTKMARPETSSMPYRLRNVMERQEGVTPQVFMPKGLRVTQALLVDPGMLVYFTGEIVDAPDVERGCRTKITVRVDGDVERLWRNWDYALHRSTCLGDVSKDLERFCRLARVRLVNEAA
ncbi:MAG TPA: hypothetical protein P5568_12825 [Acidobacteriota bacterium]|nr:hypothetical protein [Acidobacteriota bacterium]HRV09342.1 hypothetical protein [Acidobacteriota bacterium]